MKKHTPLSEVKNFGPVTLAEFEAMDIDSLEQILELGFEDCCRKWVESFPDRLNVNAFVGIITAIDGVSWVKATRRHKKKAFDLAKQMRAEQNGLIF